MKREDTLLGAPQVQGPSSEPLPVLPGPLGRVRRPLHRVSPLACLGFAPSAPRSPCCTRASCRGGDHTGAFLRTRHPPRGRGWRLPVPAPGLAPGGLVLAPPGAFLALHSRVGSFPLCREGSIQDPPLLSECVLSQDFVIRSDGFSHHLPPPRPDLFSALLVRASDWCPEGSQFGGGGQVGLGGFGSWLRVPSPATCLQQHPPRCSFLLLPVALRL